MNAEITAQEVVEVVKRVTMIAGGDRKRQKESRHNFGGRLNQES